MFHLISLFLLLTVEEPAGDDVKSGQAVAAIPSLPPSLVSALARLGEEEVTSLSLRPSILPPIPPCSPHLPK